MIVDFAPSGSTDGRRQWLSGTVDFAASELPFQRHPDDGSPPEVPAPGSYAYIPITAGGTSFVYNLKVNGQLVRNLRLSGENIARIFTRVITRWSDPALAADNPAILLPDQPIIPVVRAEPAGTTSQLTGWMASQQPSLWNDYCARIGRSPCQPTDRYPTAPGMIAQAGDLGVAGYVAQSSSEGTIGYVNYSYALGSRLPVAKMLNAAGYYTAPTPTNVAVALLRAEVNDDQSSDDYLTEKLDGVYANNDPRTYPLSYYGYMILSMTLRGPLFDAKGRSIGAFASYAMCQGQQRSAALGYAPMPINLVRAALDQIRRVPGAVEQDISTCNNPTFTSAGTDLLTSQAPYPADCDQTGPIQCDTSGGPPAQVPEGHLAWSFPVIMVAFGVISWRRRRSSTMSRTDVVPQGWLK